MTATVRQLLDDLAADVSMRWAIFGFDIRTAVRRCGGLDCPLSWLAKTEPCDVEAAAAKLGLSEGEAAEIANAADDEDHPLRAELLRACRLSEGA